MRRRKQQRENLLSMENGGLGMNDVLAKGGFPYEQMREMSNKQLIFCMDTLTIGIEYRADADFYMRELLRREQTRTNILLIWLASAATVAACLQAAPVAIGFFHWLLG